MTLYHVIIVDASALRMHSALDTTEKELGELKELLLLFVPTISHVAYAKRTLCEFMELCHAVGNVKDASSKHMRIVLDTEKDKLMQLLHSLAPVTHVAYAKKTFSKMTILYHALNNIRDALIERTNSVPMDTQRRKLHSLVPVTYVAYARRTLSRILLLYRVDSNFNDALIEHMHSVLDIQNEKPERLQPLLALNIRVAYVNEKLSKTMASFRASSISVIKDASIEHMHSVLVIK